MGATTMSAPSEAEAVADLVPDAEHLLGDGRLLDRHLRARVRGWAEAAVDTRRAWPRAPSPAARTARRRRGARLRRARDQRREGNPSHDDHTESEAHLAQCIRPAARRLRQEVAGPPGAWPDRRGYTGHERARRHRFSGLASQRIVAATSAGLLQRATTSGGLGIALRLAGVSIDRRHDGVDEDARALELVGERARERDHARLRDRVGERAARGLDGRARRDVDDAAPGAPRCPKRRAASRLHRKALTRFWSSCARSAASVVSVAGAAAKPPAACTEAHRSGSSA